MLYFFIFVLYEIVLACVVFVLYAGCKKKQKDKTVLYFSAHGTRSGILCYIFCAWNALWYYCVIYFPRVECALELLCYIFCAWNALWYYCAIYFPRVERALALLCYIFRVWNALWRYCVIFLPVEHALVFCVKLILCCNILTLLLFHF